MTDTPVTPELCANCGTPLEGEFCWNCGQRAKEPRRIVLGLVQDVIVETMAIDGKLARTVYTLFVRPGRLAQEYIAGKRVRYSPPFRLYLFTSVIFFFLTFTMISQYTGVENPPEPAAPTTEAELGVSNAVSEMIAGFEAGATGQTDGDNDGEDEGETGPLDSSGPIVVIDPGDSEENYDDAPEWLKPIIERMETAGDRLEEDPRLFFSQARENVPRVMLLAPVIYGLMLVILYVYRRKFLIYDHLVVALYMHAALYAYLVLIMLLSFIPIIGSWVWLIPFVWGVVQSYAVLRQAYQSNWFSVIAKGLIINTTYFILLSILISAGLGLALYNS
ncbi:MAG: DUF3667 domain-containing protein [Pseudomonadota bacterium]